jgi:hypothetical protein
MMNQAIREKIDQMLDMHGSVTVSMLQRKLKVSHDEALRIVEKLTEEMNE